MKQDTNIQIAVESVIVQNRDRATVQSFIVLSVALIATTLIGWTSLAAMSA